MQTKFADVIEDYIKLRDSLKDDFKNLLVAEEIKFQLFSDRIKEFDKFLEKVRRKGYKEPFNENEDFCGFRVVSFYLNDIERIDKILRQNFKIVSTEDKVEETEVHHFGYRSKHYVAKLKKEWLKLPKFKDFADLKFEIQIRTLNMHSWSEASHKLDYKNEEFVPKQLRRKLFIASAFLEQADVIFEELRKEVELLSLREDILTIHSLKRFLEKKFPNKKTEDYKIVWLFQELREAKISFEEINSGYELLKEHLPQIEKDVALRWQATGATRAILDITCDKFFAGKQSRRSERWYNGVSNWRSKLKNKQG